MNSVDYSSSNMYNITISPLINGTLMYIKRRVTLSVTIGAYTKLQSIPYCNFSIFKNGASLLQL